MYQNGSLLTYWEYIIILPDAFEGGIIRELHNRQSWYFLREFERKSISVKLGIMFYITVNFE